MRMLTGLLAILVVGAASAQSGARSWSDLAPPPAAATTLPQLPPLRGSGALQLFADRPAFEAATAHMQLAAEDFSAHEATQVSPCREPLNIAMGQPGTIFLAPYCFEVYEMVPGLSIRSEQGAFAALNTFAFGGGAIGLPVNVVGAMGPMATLLDFTEGPHAVAMDGYDWQAGSPLTFTVYGAGDVVLGDFMLTPASPPQAVFAGFIAPEPVRRVTIRSASGASQMVARLRFGGSGPSVQANLGEIDFGPVALAAQATRSVDLVNTGDLSTQLPVIAAPAAPFAIESDACSGQTLAPGASCSLLLDYDPVYEQTDRASLTVTGAEELIVALSGRGVAPRLQAEDRTVEFGLVNAGDQAVAGTRIGNPVAVPLQVLAIPAPPAPFQREPVPGECPATPFVLAPGESCALAWRLQPTGNGNHLARVLVASDDPSTPIRLLLRGTTGDSIFANGFE